MLIFQKKKDLLVKKDKEVIEGYIKIHGVIHEFNSKEELNAILYKQ